MPIDYVRRVRQLEWQDLRLLWRQIESGTVDGWPPGRALEHLVLRAFELSGASVAWPYQVRVGDEVVEQIDGAVHVHGLSCIVECKDTAAPVNIELIAKLRNQLLSRPSGATGLLFSRSGFTEAAMTLAGFLAPQSLLLWTGGEIAYMLEREDFSSALLRKYRRSIEDGLLGSNRVQELAQ